jgi:hypothetical protein
MTTDEHRMICRECYARWLYNLPRKPNPHCEGCEQYVGNFDVLPREVIK